jgi:hypothetical protein
MNIILGEEQAKNLREKYTVLELDTFCINDLPPVKSYAVIENLPIPEMFSLDSMIDLHQNMIDQYHKQDWNYCLDALEHLYGRWNGEIDSFYLDITDRIKKLASQSLDDEWTGNIIKTTG